MNKKFFNTVIGYIFPLGSNHDPRHKLGLLNATIKSFKFGLNDYPDPIDYFFELDKLGVSSTYGVNREYSYILFRTPWEQKKEAKKFLDEVLMNVKTTHSDLEKIKDQMKLELKELKTDTIKYTGYKFKNFMLGENSPYGTLDCIDNIRLEDIESIQSKLQKNHSYVGLSEDKKLEGELEKLENFNIEAKKYSPKDNLQILNNDLKQKVVFLGYKMPGLKELDYFTVVIAKAILYHMGNGKLYQKIRKENSAAYYVWVLLYKAINRISMISVFGVSEKNLLKSLNLTREVFESVKKSNIEEDLHLAKVGLKASLREYYDNEVSLYSFLFKLYLAGQVKFLTYDKASEKIFNITEDDVVRFYDSVFERKIYTMINGSLDSEIKKKVEKVIYNWKIE